MILAAFAVTYAFAIIGGRATRLGGGEVALAWPAAAVAIIWLLVVRHRAPVERGVHLAALAAVTFAANLVTGAPMGLAAWFVLVNLTLAVVTVTLLTWRGTAAVLRDPVDLAHLVAAVTAGASCAAVLATMYLAASGDVSVWETFALFVVRNGASVLLGVSIWLRLRDVVWRLPKLTVGAIIEAIAVAAVVALTFVWTFWVDTGLSLAFLSLAPAMWLALRYSTTVSTVFLAVAGAWIVFATLSGRGGFAVADPQTRALLAQTLVCSLTIVTLALSLYRDSRARLITELKVARDLFAGVLQAASEQAIIGTDPSGRITVFNNGAERLLGWARTEMLGRSLLDVLHPPEVSSRAAILGIPVGFEVLICRVSVDRADVREWTYVRRDGTQVQVSLAVSQMVDPAGACSGYIGVATDITEQKAAEQALAESEERFRLAFDTAPMGMFLFDVTPGSAGCITRCNQAMATLIGREVGDVPGLLVTDLCDEHSESCPDSLGRLHDLGIGDRWEAEVALRRADGRVEWGAASASVIAPRGSVPYGICLVEQITARKQAEAALQQMALHDQLTGLANRALLMDRAEQALAEARGDERGGVGVIFLDLDGFKTINDTWGHGEGDEVLTVVAQRIQASIRSHDTAARLGGDEFAVLCPGISDPAQIQSVAERIRAEVRHPIELSTGHICDQLSVSAGVATSQSDSTAETLLRRADALMYHSKRSGKDRITSGAHLEQSAMMAASQLISELERAVHLEEFVVHFQPIVELATGRCVAMEALLRWGHPEQGLLRPDRFLVVAENSPHMPAIGRYVLNEACRQAAQWTGTLASAAIHVNVSGRQLEVGDLHSDVMFALELSGLSPHRLVLELTETYAGRIASSARADLDRLRDAGVLIAIDDVGTGFSGLAKIVDLPIDILKIDKQFIAGLPDDARCAAVTQAVLSLGATLGLSVIAEGVETAMQCGLLIEWGCASGQGYLFGRSTSLCADDADELATG